MNQESGHAVVLGASMGGLLAARTLADFFERVTVIERDELPATVRDRRGVPQGRHFHALLARGAQALDSMFPGLVDGLVTAGAPRLELLREVRLVLSGHEMVRADTGDLVIHLTRAMLEGAVRARVTEIANIKIIDGCDVIGLHTGNGGRVAGARIRHRAASRDDVVTADLVVDAMGRAGRTRAWLSELGYQAPAEDRIKIDVGYVSRFLRLPDGALGADLQVLVGPVPGRPTVLGLAAQEDDRWVLTLGGMAGDHPSSDEREFLAFAKAVAPPDVYAAIRDAEPLSELASHKFPASVRRRYERLRRFPAGLLVFGDAICSFNPIHGQGMTVAALEAEALRRCLLAGDHDLARRFFRAAAKVVDVAWQLSAGGDLALPEIKGKRPIATRIINRYLARLHRAAAHDATVASALVRVGSLTAAPMTILTPAIMLRVLIGGRAVR